MDNVIQRVYVTVHAHVCNQASIHTLGLHFVSNDDIMWKTFVRIHLRGDFKLTFLYLFPSGEPLFDGEGTFVGEQTLKKLSQCSKQQDHLVAIFKALLEQEQTTTEQGQISITYFKVTIIFCIL